ncbi:MAG: hypothetical protein COV46_00475 [Deltaproteobacteria bacterium CG11_big_fil_rev_8_21_14_0_20_49_13]|nr:MAG: hypothetical protein COV46_00475 [Deltaproteobacteria bacterium CG11_big_fil_rev_8_21_14_0_20_49_13]
MKKGVILIHGLTGTPATMAPLTEILSRKGFKVITPLLPGHGTSPEELSRTTWEEWCAAVLISYNKLANDCDEAYCAGLSLGSLLTLKLAIERDVKRIICMGTPLRLSPMIENLTLPISRLPVINRLIKTSKKYWEASVKDPEGREIYRNLSYPVIPVRSVWELQKLQKNVSGKIGSIKAKALIVHSKNDKAAPPFNVGLLASKLATPPEVLLLERSEHVVTLDLEKDLVAERILKFLS